MDAQALLAVSRPETVRRYLNRPLMLIAHSAFVFVLYKHGTGQRDGTAVHNALSSRLGKSCA
jgi:hypothetical protein